MNGENQQQNKYQKGNKKTNFKKICKLNIIFLLTCNIFIILSIFNIKNIKYTINQNNLRKLLVTNTCQNNKRNKCLTCNSINHICQSCNKGYKLIDGKCIINYSMKIIYNSNLINQNIKLINNVPGEILEMIIDEQNVEPCINYTFTNIGNHTVYILMDTTNTSSLEYMFYKIDKMISISFTEVICFLFVLH